MDPKGWNSRRRNKRAASLLEVSIGLLLLLPVFMLILDMFVLFASSICNFEVCRQAARAAADGPPDMLLRGSPRQRAFHCIREARLPHAIISIEPEVEVTEKLQSSPDLAIFGGPVRGTVTVTTVANVTPPFLLPVILQTKTFQLRARQTYPYSWTIVPGASQAENSR